MILKKGSDVFLTAVALCCLQVTASGVPTENDTRPLFCHPAPAAVFTPARPSLGVYDVCTDARPLRAFAPPDWRIDALEAVDAFGTAGDFNPLAMARLYAGTRAQVARRWADGPDHFEVTTFVSPYPNAGLTRLEPGTLVIRWRCSHSYPECRIPGTH